MEEGDRQTGLPGTIGHSVHIDSSDGTISRTSLPLSAVGQGTPAAQPGNQNARLHNETSSKGLCSSEDQSKCVPLEQSAHGSESSITSGLDCAQEHSVGDAELPSESLFIVEQKRGSPPGSRGRGRPSGAVGIGRPPGSVGKGRPLDPSTNPGYPPENSSDNSVSPSFSSLLLSPEREPGCPIYIEETSLQSDSSLLSTSFMSPKAIVGQLSEDPASTPQVSSSFPLSDSSSIKRGPGRPRKHPLSQPVFRPVIKRGLGRPPQKLNKSYFSFSESSETGHEHHPKISEDPASTPQDSSSFPLSDSSSIKRGPGRPRKHPLSQPSFHPVIKRGPGRPPQKSKKHYFSFSESSEGGHEQHPKIPTSTRSDTNLHQDQSPGSEQALLYNRAGCSPGNTDEENFHNRHGQEGMQEDGVCPDVTVSRPRRPRGRPRKDSASRLQQQTDTPFKAPSSDIHSSNSAMPPVHQPENTPILPKHSTPMVSASMNPFDLDTSISVASPIEGRRSRRERKKTEKGEDLEKYLLQQKRNLDESEVQKPKTTGKRGRPRKFESTKGNTSVENDAMGTCHQQTQTMIESDKELTDSSESAEDVSNVTLPSKRKRGHPRKIVFTEISDDSEPADDVQIVSSVTVPSKRKRGRPCKVVFTKDISDDSEFEDDVQAMSREAVPRERKRGHPCKIVVTKEISDDSEFEDDVQAMSSEVGPVERKRGRPCKVVFTKEISDDSEFADDVQAMSNEAGPVKRKRGRPCKIVVTKDISDDSEFADDVQAMSNEAMPMKRKKGSPCKVVFTKDISDDVEFEDDVKAMSSEAVPVKRKRGRPRKSDSTSVNLSLENDATERYHQHTQSVVAPGTEIADVRESKDEVQTVTNETTPLKKRGRPRKSESSKGNTSADFSGAAVEETAKALTQKRGRGRPRKSDSLTSTTAKTVRPAPESSAASKQEEEIQTCPRCGDVLADHSSYVTHLRNKHAALYTKKCPEGEQSYAAWQRILKIFKKILCPDCHKQFKGAQFFKFHRQWCGREEETETCERCGHTLKAMWMYHHELSHRKKDQLEEIRQLKEAEKEKQMQEEGDGSHKRKAATAALKTLHEVYSMDDEMDAKESKSKKKKGDDNWTFDHAEDENEDDDDEDGDTGVDEEDNSQDRVDNKKSRKGNTQRSPKASNASVRGSSASDGRLILFPSLPPLDFFKEHESFLAQLENPEWHCDLLPQVSHWTPLHESKTGSYLPSQTQSISVSIAQRGASTRSTTLHWGDALCDDNQATAFVGGSVLSSEWCPLDLQTSREQVLAVSVCTAVQDEDLSLFTRGNRPAVIQFWSAGMLGCTQSSCSPDLKLSFTLVHDSGHAVSIAWCPRGGYLDQPPSGGDTLQRLGLLAVAGWDTTVHIYSIPTPESLSDQTCGTSGKSESPPNFMPPPSLTLTCVKPEEYGPCLSVAWQKGEGCDFIAAGYGQGYVQLWHLSAPWQRSGPTGNALSPVRSFIAHNTAVLSIDWSWQEASHFVTGSLDCDYKVWDMENTSLPLVCPQANRRDMGGPIRTVMFSSAAMDTVLMADDQRDKYSGNVSGLDLSGTRRMCLLNKHAATVWTFGYSDWYNVIVSGDCTGMLSLANLFPLINPSVKKYTQKRKGLSVFTTTMSTDTDETELESLSTDDVHVKFTDRSMEHLRNWANEEEFSVCKQEFGKSFGADILSVRFNPNRTSSHWVAVGTRAGILRLIQFRCLSTLYKSSLKMFRGEVGREKAVDSRQARQNNPMLSPVTECGAVVWKVL